MNSESLRIADQLRRAFTGDPWHGSPLLDLLAGITAEQARARPLPSVHSIWELVLHVDVYLHAAFDATQGIAMPKLYGTEADWPTVSDGSAAAWIATRNRLFENGGGWRLPLRTSTTRNCRKSFPVASTISTTSFTALCSTAYTTVGRSLC